MNFNYVCLIFFTLFTSNLVAQESLLDFCQNRDYEAINEHIAKRPRNYPPSEVEAIINCLDLFDESLKRDLVDHSDFGLFVNLLYINNLQRSGLSDVDYYSVAKHVDWFKSQFERQEDWNLWFIALRVQGANAYHLTNGVLLARKSYLEMMEKWEKFDVVSKVQASVSAGNHFMGVEQDYERASEILRRGLAVEGLSDGQKTYLYFSLSELYLRKKDLDRALEYSNKILSISTLSAHERLKALALSGRVKIALGDYLEAEKDLKEAEVLYLDQFSAGAWNGLIIANFCYVYSALLSIQMNKGAWKKAKEYEARIRMSQEYLNEIGHPYFYLVEILLRYYNATDQHEHFLGYYENIDAMAGARMFLPFFSKIYTEAGNYWSKNKDYDKAMENYNKALDLLKDNNEAGGTAPTFTQDEPQALVTLTRKIESLKAIKEAGLVKLEFYETFYQTTQQAVLLLDEVRQNISSKESKLKMLNLAPIIYEAALESVYQKYKEEKKAHYLEEIYQLIEKSKAILLQDALNEDNAKGFGGIPDELRKTEKDLINDIKFYKSKLYKAKAKGDSLKIASFQNIIFEKNNALESLKEQLEKDYPKYFALKFKRETIAIQSIQAKLRSHDAQFISYFVGRRNLYIFHIQEDAYAVRVEPLPNPSIPNFRRSLLALRTGYSDIAKSIKMKPDQFNRLTNLSHRLYTLLLASELEQCTTKRLIISADGFLHYIPFEALLTQEEDQGEIDFKNLSYLIKKHQISYNYTATLWLKSLETSQKLKQKKGGVLGMAATYSTSAISMNEDWRKIRESLDELEGAKAEVAFLEKTYVGKYWIGASATEAQFRKDASDYSIIHLAMHGLVDNSRPMNSGLVFTENGDSTTENVLLAYELSSLDLNTNLLVLSACSTGDGKYKNGEGVMSLGRGFMYAGVASILTTLWQINDQSSQEIMQLFYENLHQGMDKDMALQQAKNTYIDQVNGIAAHPAFWAAYVLQGDLSSVEVSKPINWFPWGAGLLAILGAIFLWTKKRRA